MALTRDIIENSSDHIDDVAKLIIISLLRELENYRTFANLFSPKLIPAIDVAEGTLKARQINAILKEVDKLGIGEVELNDPKDGIKWSQTKERQALVMQLFTTLFDDAQMTGGGAGDNFIVVSKGNFGVAAVGQRPCFHTSPCKCNH